MRFHKQHEQTNFTQVKKTVDSLPLGLLITSSGSSGIKTGLYNSHYDEKRFLIHLGRTDEQTYDLQQNRYCKFIYYEALSVIPSFWTDEKYGGAINNFFKFLQFDCEARIIEEPKELVTAMQTLLDHYQEEKAYVPLDPNSPIYREKFLQICAVELKVISVRSKWNLGQTKPLSAQKNILEQLKIRGQAVDIRTLSEMENWM